MRVVNKARASVAKQEAILASQSLDVKHYSRWGLTSTLEPGFKRSAGTPCYNLVAKKQVYRRIGGV